jgi:hypothetical protein
MKISNVKSYIVDLDVEPEKRWKQIIDDHKQYFPRVEQEIDNILKNVGILGGVSKGIVSLFSSSGNVMYKRELKGISELSGVPMNKLILMQICYEMFSACTSVVIRGNTHNYHFRTMDWEMDFLRDLTVNVTFVKNGIELYKSATWAGYVGVVTGVNDKYSLALNYRRSKGTLLGNVMRTIKMKWPIGYMVRYIFEQNMSVDDAYEAITSYKLISPCYITFCQSSGEGRVLVRDHDKLVKERSLSDHGYLIQTNHDSDDSEVNIMWSFERYKKANSILESYNFNNGICDNVNTENVLKNFLVRPIINPHTIYASLLVPNKFDLKSFVCKKSNSINKSI